MVTGTHRFPVDFFNSHESLLLSAIRTRSIIALRDVSMPKTHEKSRVDLLYPAYGNHT